MELNSGLFSTTVLWWTAGLYLSVFGLAVHLAPWRRVLFSKLLHVFLGSCVALVVLWSIKAQINGDLTFHLLGVTALTLMCGWSFAVIGSAIALVGVTLNAGSGWEMFPVNAMLLGVIPITLTQVTLVVIRSLLPKNFFVYVLVNAFLTAGLTAMLVGYLAAGLLVWSGSYSLAELSDTIMPFFPLMFMPEAFLNGWIMTVMVVYRPHWVYSFSDELYIKGK
ncbi:MAG: energy-coupling factor ABC transporter permease [Chromatiales bacterium]|nr:energy-coupling factor ABC transporter permease [Chromatiales bacterium]